MNIPIEKFRDYRKTMFAFEGRKAILVFPDDSVATKNWLLKTEYFGAFSGVELEMLNHGWHLAYLENRNRWGIDADIDVKKSFASELQKQYGLHSKCVPVGMSAGGLHAVKLAAKYPEMISALYLDAPVINILSMPGIVDLPEQAGIESLRDEILTSLDMTLLDLIGYREHPLDMIPRLITNQIPLILVYGSADTIVPYAANGLFLEQAYRDSEIDFEVCRKENCGHHPHGLDDVTPITDFILRYAS